MAGTPPPFSRPTSVASGVRRSALFTFGVLLATFCYAVTVRAELGLGPLFVLQDGISKHTGMSLGDAVMVTGVASILLALCLRTLPGPGTLAWPFISGLFLNWVLPRLPVIHGYGFRLAAVVAATLAMALGGACAFRAAVGVSAYDSVMLALHRVTGRPLAPLRVAMELTVLMAGWLLGGAVGVGTIITGLCIGPAIQFWIRALGGIPGTKPEPAAAPADLRHHPLAALETLVEPPGVEAATYEAAGLDPERERTDPAA
ncbi:MAG: YczE/YyaS/YitT family protein [Acidimicrobiales bacterium]